MDKRIGIIGCGNMGEALLKGLSTVAEKSTRLMVSELDAKRREAIQSKYKIIVEIDNNLVVKNSDVIIIAVKPKDFEGLLRNILAAGISDKKLVISIAAGITTKHVESILGHDIPVIRAMPNMAAVIGESITSLSRGRAATNKDIQAAREVFSLVGEVVEVEESLVDAVTAVSGSGPAYFFYLMEALEEAAEELGLNRQTSRRLIIKTALGSAKILDQLNEEPSAMRQRVTSKGGTTEAALKVFESGKLKSMIRDALKAALKRSRELSGG